MRRVCSDSISNEPLGITQAGFRSLGLRRPCNLNYPYSSLRAQNVSVLIVIGWGCFALIDYESRTVPWLPLAEPMSARKDSTALEFTHQLKQNEWGRMSQYEFHSHIKRLNPRRHGVPIQHPPMKPIHLPVLVGLVEHARRESSVLAACWGQEGAVLPFDQRRVDVASGQGHG